MSEPNQNDFEKQLPATLALLNELVNIESPSTEKLAVDRLSARMVAILQELGGQVELIEKTTCGNQVRARWGEGTGQILLLCHMDTVFGTGTTAARPFSVDGDRAFGPGVLDMKGGIAILIATIRFHAVSGRCGPSALSAD